MSTSSTATYRIAEVAARSGYSPPTLRYYEDIGLLPPPERSANGYRVYDDSTLDRLSFISRAKQLGCSLEEITDLSTAWDGGSCAHVQAHLRRVVDTKVNDAQSRIAELTAFVATLQDAAHSLHAHTPEGPCDDQCGCTSSAPTSRKDPLPVALTSKPSSTTAKDDCGCDVPIACTLGATDMDQRLADWQALLAHVQERHSIDHGLRLVFDPATSIGELARLAAAEQDCCRFFTFALTIDQRGTALEVTAPDDAQPVLAGLFGTAE